MSPFFQVIGGVLLAVIMGLTLSKLNKDISAVLGIGVCCMVMIVMAAQQLYEANQWHSIYADK